MTNKRFLMGILAMTLAFGIAFVGCVTGGGTDSGSGGASSNINGTWDSAARNVLIFNNGNFEFSSDASKMLQGTYTVSGANVTIRHTGAWGPLFTKLKLEESWYSRGNLKNKGVDDRDLDYFFYPIKGTLDGNKLDVSWHGAKETFTKRGGTASSGSSTGRYMLVNSDTLNVRSGPSADYSVVGVLNRNARVEVLDRPGTWWKIKSGNIEGYVNSSYLKAE
jgi:uncharacterized protein YgiM (DUF1202 family)